MLAAWEAARRAGEELVVAGLDEAGGAATLGSAAARRRACASRGCSRATDYRALLRRARVFVCAPRREDYGIAQLEALADGCLLVTTPSPGPVRRAAAGAAARLAARGRDRRGDPDARSTTPRPATPSARAELLAPWRPEAVDAVVREQLLPAVSVAGMTPISGQSVLITGAAHGIGAETARRLAARGARVSLVGLGDLAAVAADCPGSVTFEADVTDRDALDAAVGGTVEAFGGIDTVFANAGIGAPGLRPHAWTRRCSSASSRST